MLLINEKVRQSDEINKLLTLQIAEDQIREAEMFSELHDHDLSSDFKSGFPRKLRKLIGDSHIFARIEKDVMLALSSKYALALYEMVQKRGNLSQLFEQLLTGKLDSKVTSKP